MNRNSRLSTALHALLHMAACEVPVTSSDLAACMGANPVLVRRTMAGLREAGFVGSAKGRGGGWSITCDLDRVSLRDVYVALDEPALFAIGLRNAAPGCLVEQAVNAALDGALREAERSLLERLGSVSLGSLAADFARRLASHPHHGSPGGHAVSSSPEEM